MNYGSPNPMGSMSSPSGQKARKDYNEQTLIPVTIRMLLNTTPSPSSDGSGALSLPDGRELHQVKIVGAIRSVEDQSTNVTFQLEDGTGMIEVKSWIDASDCAAVTEMRMKASEDNMYVRVIGQVKDYDGRKSVIGYSVKRVGSTNEFTHHMLDVVYSSGRNKGMGGGDQKPVMGAASPYGTAASSNYNNNNAFSGGTQGLPMSMPAQAAQTGSGDAAQDAVLHFIKTEGAGNELGANVQDCVRSLAGQYTDTQIRQCLENLAGDGHIYSTVNDDMFKYAM